MILLAVLLLSLSASCKNSQEEKRRKEEKTDKIFLITDDTPNCSMIISDEVYKFLNKDEDYSYILDLMNDYFNIVINNEIDPNTVYIKAVSEKIDAEVRLAEVYEPSNKVSLVIQIAEAGMTVFPEYAVYSEEPVTAPADTTGNQLYADLAASLKKTADKASVYSVKSIKDEFMQKTDQIYSKSEKIISENNVSKLKYGDYYINIDNSDGITIICGSQESVLNALDYFLTEYVLMGTSEEGSFAIDTPDSNLHVGHYINCTIANRTIKDYSIVYYCDSSYYDSRENAKYLQQFFLKYSGNDLFIKDTDSSRNDIKHKIVIGRSKLEISENYYASNPDIMDFSIVQKGNDLYIMGGSDWAIKYAIDYLIEEFFSKDIPVPFDYSHSGSMYGEYVFKKSDTAALRIMSSNVWDYGGNTYEWMTKGENCDNINRFKDIAKVYMAYNPDILSFQELNPRPFYSSYMLNAINDCGRNYKFVDGYFTSYIVRNHTPIMYNADTLNLLDGGSYLFPIGQNSDSKSYTWGYFEEKSTGYRFIAFSTHLWWKRDVVRPGSSLLRAEQMTMICKEADRLIEQYGCPVFVMGDFNCKSSAQEFKTMSENDFVDCHEIATDYSNNSSGRYICNIHSFSCKPSAGTYKKNSIDHILVKDLKKASVSVYSYAMPNFYGKLSDHAPVYIDLRIRAS